MRLHGTLDGVVAGSFFVIPSIFVLWLLSYLAVAHSNVPAITGLLYGILPVVFPCPSRSWCLPPASVGSF